MTNKQIQEPATGATAIQSARDTNYSTGLTSGELTVIITSLSDSVDRVTLRTREIIDDRLDIFKRDLIDKIASDSTFRKDAFCDPDFLNSVSEAQKAYARSGDEGLKHALIELVSQRSKQTVRNRLTLTLNDAISKSASLTEEDFAALSVLFLARHVQHNVVRRLEDLANNFRQYYDPIFQFIPRDEIANSYLASHGCLMLSGIRSRVGLYARLAEAYPGVVTNGITQAEMETLIPTSHPAYNVNVKPSRFSAQRLVIDPGDIKSLNTGGPMAGLSADLGDRYIALAQANPTNEEEFRRVFGELYENTNELFEFFSKTALSHASLTSLGIALGHANLVQKSQLGADLSIWIE